MAYATNATTTTAAAGGLRDRLSAIRAAWSQWRVYRRTLDELSELSDRELSDLGVARGSIRAIALEAAYGRRA